MNSHRISFGAKLAKIILILKAPITTAADDNFFYFIFFFFFFFFFSEKTSLDISCELSAKQTIHMKCQDLFSLGKKKKKKMNVVCYKFCLVL